MRHRSVTLSHHSSRNSQPRSTHSHPFSGDTSSRSHTLTEEIGTLPPGMEVGLPPSSLIQPVQIPYTPCQGVPTPHDYPREWEEGFRSGKYSDIPWYDRWKKGQQPVLARPVNAEAENSRAAAHCQALESPLAPQSSAIPQSEIASYPREWHLLRQI